VDVLSYLLYSQVFIDYDKHLRQYDNTSVIPTPAFFYGLQSGEEIAVEIEPGKTLIIRYLTTGEAREDGMRTIFFELNGQPREVNVPDRSLEGNLHKHPKADREDPDHVPAPMPGKVSTVAYSDPYFWRPASKQDEASSTTTFTYTPPLSGNAASTESKMLFNTNNSSIAEQLTTLDSLGRVQVSQQREDPGSGSYDSTQITYDSLGRPYQSTMPYVAGAGQGRSPRQWRERIRTGVVPWAPAGDTVGADLDRALAALSDQDERRPDPIYRIIALAR